MFASREDQSTAWAFVSAGLLVYCFILWDLCRYGYGLVSVLVGTYW
jgi:hypothetical protein